MKTSFYNEFLVLAEQLSFSRAAQKLGITQSALSRHIKQLEEDINYPLFVRTTQKIKLTPYGIAFLSHAADIVKHQQDFACTAEAIQRKLSSAIAVGVCGFPSYYGITSLLADFANRYPQTVIDVHMDSADCFPNRLHTGLLDVAFIHGAEICGEDFCVIPFREDHLSASLPYTHPLASKSALSLCELKDETFYIRHKRDSYLYKLETDILRSAGFEPKISLSKGTWEDSVISRSDSISLVMQGLADRLMGQQFVSVIDIMPRIPVNISLIYPKNRELSDTVMAFIRLAEEKSPLLSSL